MPDPAAGGLVTVIVPVYNGEPYLRDALDSIMAQDYPAIELIVVDDGSTDGTARIALGCPRALCIHQPNQGHGIAKNTGLAAAHGEFIAFLDADDAWLPGKLSHQVDTLRQNPHAGYTTGHMSFFLEPAVDRPSWVPPEFLIDPQPALLPSGLLIRRSVFDQVGNFDPGFPISNDYEWLLRARDAGVAAIVTPQVVVRRRIHAANQSHRLAERADELLRLLGASIRRKNIAKTRSAAA